MSTPCTRDATPCIRGATHKRWVQARERWAQAKYTKKFLVTGFFVERSLGSFQAGHNTLTGPGLSME
jgi:hypothetical protein